MPTTSDSSSDARVSPIPVTVFTGFLGAGKTTIIMDLLKSMPPNYNIVMLKNEFGDAETDSALVRESNIQVQEMTNGCLCCVLVGQMQSALLEMKEKFNPDRIIIETSGSAFPAPIAWQIRQMERDNFVLDAILTVIDCVNFRGYEDTSYTTKMQAKYTDLILLNKWELVSERDLDTVIDHVNELNADTPHVKVSKGEGVAPDLVFGIDTKLFELKHGQVDIEGESEGNDHHHQDEVDLISIKKHRESVDAPEIAGVTFYEADEFIKFLDQLSPSDVYRVKGLVRIRGLSAEVETSGGLGQELIAHPKAAPGPDQLSDTPLLYILNHAFGRYTFTPILHHERHGEEEDLSKVVLRATVIGIDLRLQVQRVKQGLSLEDTHISTHWANRK